MWCDVMYAVFDYMGPVLGLQRPNAREILIRHHKHAQNYYYSIKQVKLISYLSIHETTCLSFAIYMNQF